MIPKLFRAAKVLLVAGLVAAFLFQVERARDLLRANRILATVEANTKAVGAGERIPVRVIAGNLRLLREARELNPADARILLAQGGQYLVRDRCEPAVTIYREALELEPRPEIYLNLGRCLLRLDRRQEAEEAFLDAVILHPPLVSEIPAEVRPTIRRQRRALARISHETPAATPYLPASAALRSLRAPRRTSSTPASPSVASLASTGAYDISRRTLMRNPG